MLLHVVTFQRWGEIYMWEQNASTFPLYHKEWIFFFTLLLSTSGKLNLIYRLFLCFAYFCLNMNSFPLTQRCLFSSVSFYVLLKYSTYSVTQPFFPECIFNSSGHMSAGFAGSEWVSKGYELGIHREEMSKGFTCTHHRNSKHWFENRKMVMITLYAKQKKRHRSTEQNFGLWAKAKVRCFERTTSVHVYYLAWSKSPARLDGWDKCSDLVHWEDAEESGGEGRGRGDRDGNTCKSMADSRQCMAKTTTIL